MGVLARDCPHCDSKRMSFTTFGEYIWKASGKSEGRCLTALKCAGCNGGYFIESVLQTTTSPSNAQGNIDQDQYIRIVKEYPEKKEKKVPEHLPENVRSYFVQAQTSLQHKSYDASSMMSRKCLEASVKALDPSATGKLYARIESLHKKGLVTESLKDWAHIVREDGNDAAHEEAPVAEAHASELLAFSELFLMYVFTMPGMISEKRPKASQVRA